MADDTSFGFVMEVTRERVLALATLLGGLAALGYFMDKLLGLGMVRWFSTGGAAQKHLLGRAGSAQLAALYDRAKIMNAAFEFPPPRRKGEGPAGVPEHQTNELLQLSREARDFLAAELGESRMRVLTEGFPDEVFVDGGSWEDFRRYAETLARVLHGVMEEHG